MGLLQHLFLVGTLAGLGLSQDCPILGPAYPEVASPGSSAVFSAAKTAIDNEIAKALASGQLDKDTYFGVQVYSRNSDKTLYEKYYGPSIGPDTLYRIASISKLVTVYATLTELGDKYWDEPITKYIPELAKLRVKNPVYDINWSEITLGALASHLAGIPQQYALGDLSAYWPQGAPGLPTLNASEKVTCGTDGFRACTREESLAMIARAYPIAPSYRTPAYSNTAFQLLSYAVEKISGKKFPSIIEKRLLKPLKLTRTFLRPPVNDSNAIALEGWDIDIGDAAPAGGYYSSASDLTKLGRSILSSTLLSPLQTRRWLRPVTHTAKATFSLGYAWEISRLPVPVSTSPSSATTRLVDLYHKPGGARNCHTLLAISPDHGIGYSMVTAGPQVSATYAFLLEKLNTIMLAAAEQAGRDQALAVYGGNYTLPDNSVVEVMLRPGEPGLFLNRIISNGTDLTAMVGPSLGVPAGAKVGAWLYPMGLAGKGKVAFRAVLGALGLTAGETCSGWGMSDVRYGGYSADLFIFEMGKDGKAAAVEVPILKKTLKRDGEAC